MNPNQPSEAMGISNLDQCYTCGGPTYVDPPGNTEVLVTCRDSSCGLTRLCKDTRTVSVPLCLDCTNTIGGASGEPDFAWHHTVHGEECGADDHTENTDESFQWNEDGTLNKYPDDCEDEELGRELDGLASDDPEVRKESLERLKRREGGAA